MGWIAFGMQKLHFFKATKTPLKTSFSVIIPFRNEAKNLPFLIESFLKLSYNKEQLELLFVDDESEDASVLVIENALKNSGMDYTILTNKRYSNSPKKDAISLAVKKSKYPWIVTTDADCKVPEGWLTLLDAFIQKKDPKMVCMPVLFEKDASLVKQFQFFDGLSLQVVSMAGFGNRKPLLSNGANLAYKKNVFFDVAGYIDNDQYTSGDDIFLMEKIRRLYPKKIKYLKNASATVTTQCVDNWKEVLQQRIRWASKTKYQKNTAVEILGSIILLSNITFLVCILGFFLFPLKAAIFLYFILLKIVLDSIIVWMSAKFFKLKLNVLFLVLSLLLYPFILIWVIAGSFFGDYQWKGRTFKK